MIKCLKCLYLLGYIETPPGMLLVENSCYELNFFSKQLYFIMPLCDSVICNHGGSSVTVMTQQRVTQYLSMSLADPVCHEILYNTRSCEVAFRIKIKCSCQISLFLPHCKLWRITSLLDISTYSGSILDFISVLHSYCNMLDTTSVWD